MDGREQDGSHTPAEPVFRDDIARVLVVAAVLDDELDLVVRREPIEVGPVVTVRFAAARALDVDDLDDRPWHTLDAHVPARFDHDRLARVEQAVHQRVDLALQQRLAAGNLHQPAVVGVDLLDHLIERTSCGPR